MMTTCPICGHLSYWKYVEYDVDMKPEQCEECVNPTCGEDEREDEDEDEDELE